MLLLFSENKWTIKNSNTPSRFLIFSANYFSPRLQIYNEGKKNSCYWLFVAITANKVNKNKFNMWVPQEWLFTNFSYFPSLIFCLSISLMDVSVFFSCFEKAIYEIECPWASKSLRLVLELLRYRISLI